MIIGAGMTSAITNPLHEPEMTGVLDANVVMGHDPNCQKWIRRFREPAAEGEGAGGEGGRRRRRREGRPGA
jgi:5-methyltetrahydrofolate--homocysteine methyltransferase